MKQIYNREQLERHIEEALREIGIAEGHYVLDCCCGSGMYTAAAATLVGEGGLVYAIDKNNKKLNDLRRKADLSGLKNIKIMEEDVALKIPYQTVLSTLFSFMISFGISYQQRIR